MGKKYVIDNSTLTAIADSIRAKKGSTANIKPENMAMEIQSISESTDEIVLQDKAVTPTKSTQKVTADSGYTALGEVTVKPIPNEYIIPEEIVEIYPSGGRSDPIEHDVTEAKTVLEYPAMNHYDYVDITDLSEVTTENTVYTMPDGKQYMKGICYGDNGYYEGKDTVIPCEVWTDQYGSDALMPIVPPKYLLEPVSKLPTNEEISPEKIYLCEGVYYMPTSDTMTGTYNLYACDIVKDESGNDVYIPKIALADFTLDGNEIVESQIIVPPQGYDGIKTIIYTAPNVKEDSPLPIEVATETEMTELLESAEVGSVYKYTGESGTYENGALYVVEESE